MKNLFVVLFVLVTNALLAQPVINPLLSDRSDIDWSLLQEKSNENTFDSSFYYILDTLELPFLDDFTTNKFQQYDAEVGDPNIQDSTLYALWDVGLTAPEPWGTAGMLDTTYRITVDSLNDGTITYDSVPLASADYHYFDLSQYPTPNNPEELWPEYNIYDTLFISGDESDTVYFQPPDRIQDSATIFIVYDTMPDVYWTDSRAYWNFRYPYNPNSQGVATLDGLDANGIPYQLGNLNAHGLADVLTSKAINLNVPASDSVYFSFTYQAKGLGNSPEESDSLVLEFYSPTLDQWTVIWSTPGDIQDSVNNLVHIPIIAPDLLQNGFKFRFKNYANLSGSLDHWHIDYVHLRAPASYQDDIINDLAIMYPLHTLLGTYTFAPWKHYKVNPSFFMGNNNKEVPVRNNYNQAKQTNPGDIFVDYDGVNQMSFNVGDPLGNYSANSTYNFPFDFSSTGYSFDPNVNDTSAVFEVRTVLTTPTNPELLTVNDTAIMQQQFYNYYGYDDASAEAAFGINGQGAMMAMRFDMPQADTLRAVRLYFSPFNDDYTDRIFFLTIWDDNNGEPGDILYQDDFFTASTILYDQRINNYRYYFFNGDYNSFLEVPETFYVGWSHNDEPSLNIGFDRNIDTHDKVFYSLGSTWQPLTDAFAGTPMIQPVVSSKMNYILGVEEKEEVVSKTSVYPNPSKGVINFTLANPNAQYTLDIHDLSGRQLVKGEKVRQSYDISDLKDGVYIITLTNLTEHREETFKVVKK